MAKAYFVIPNFFSLAQDPDNNDVNFYFDAWSVGGVNQINSVYWDEAVTSNDMEYARTDNDYVTIKPIPPWNIWNPFYNTSKLTFDTQTYYGQSTGTQTGSDYGSWTDKIHLDRVLVTDNGGIQQLGAFGIEYDDTQNFNFTLVAGIGGDDYYYYATWDTNTGATTFTQEGIPIDTFGWIDNTGEASSDTQDGNVSKYLGEVISIPHLEEEDRDYTTCCPNSIVLASTDDASPQKNDVFGAYHEKKAGEGVMWQIWKDGAGIPTPGFVEINTFTNLQTLTFNWRDMLLARGEGTYQIKKVITLNGIEIYTQSYNSLRLKEFGWDVADGTVRVLSEFNNKFESKSWTFKDTNFKHSVRLRGHMSNEQYELINENNVNTDFQLINNYKRIESVHTLQINGVRDCVWTDLPNLMLLADTIKISDYNAKNYTYKYSDYEVELESFNEATYTPTLRQGNYTISLKDKKITKISKYD